jgi:hypothetical protein
VPAASGSAGAGRPRAGRRAAGIPGFASGAALATVLALAAAPRAEAVIPSAAAVQREIARINVQAGRSQPLVLELAVRDESGQPWASARALLDPAAPARLHVTRVDGQHELHERTADGRYSASREGVRIERPLPLLPPVALLQAREARGVAAALAGVGGDPERVDLGMADGTDCWVLGGRDPGPFDASRRPSYWLDQDGRRPVRIDEAGGVRFRFGPPARYGGAIFFPAWYTIEAPGWPSWRVEVRAVTTAGTASAPRPAAATAP